MKTITVSAFTVLPPYSSDQEDTIAVALFSSKFPLRYGEHGIVLSARALATGSAGSVVITVGLWTIHDDDATTELSTSGQTIQQPWEAEALRLYGRED